MKQLTTSSLTPWLLATCLGAGWTTAGAAESGVAVQKVQIADGVYQFITSPDGYVPNGNSVVIVNENDVLVFDTFSAAVHGAHGSRRDPQDHRSSRCGTW